MNFVYVFIGGGLGSICRYSISLLLGTSSFTFPLATFLANAISCLILGALVGLSLKNALGNPAKLLLMTGFCGGFSTFSTFTNETYQLFLSNDWFYALLNIGLSLMVCLICIYLGLRLTA